MCIVDPFSPGLSYRSHRTQKGFHGITRAQPRASTVSSKEFWRGFGRWYGKNGAGFSGGLNFSTTLENWIVGVVRSNRPGISDFYRNVQLVNLIGTIGNNKIVRFIRLSGSSGQQEHLEHLSHLDHREQWDRQSDRLIHLFLLFCPNLSQEHQLLTKGSRFRAGC